MLELGVGNGNQARIFLDEFRELDRRHGRDYYRRLHYLMGDYSPHVLDLARKTVAHHAEHVSSLVAGRHPPRTSLGFLRDKAFLLYISNVYDNLPTDEVAQLGGRTYQVETRAFLPAGRRRPSSRRSVSATAELARADRALLRLGPELLGRGRARPLPRHRGRGRVLAASLGGAAAGGTLRPARRAWTRYQIAPSVSGEMLRPLLESGARPPDARQQRRARAASPDSLPLLHPLGEARLPRPVRDRQCRATGPGSAARASTTGRSSTG